MLFWILISVIILLNVIIFIGYTLLYTIFKLLIVISDDIDNLNEEIKKGNDLYEKDSNTI